LIYPETRTDSEERNHLGAGTRADGTHGRIERFLGTLKHALDCWQVADTRMLQRSHVQFLFFYNRVRPHQSLDGQTPIEAWEGIDPTEVKPKRVSYFRAWEGLLTGFYIRR